MQKKLLVFLGSAIILLAGCKKAGNPTSAIIGTWTQIKQVMQSTGAAVTIDATNAACIVNNKFTFVNDGTCTLTYTGVSGCYVYGYITLGEPDKPVTGTWAVSGEGYTLTSQGVGTDAKITGTGQNAQLTLTTYIPAIHETITATYTR